MVIARADDGIGQSTDYSVRRAVRVIFVVDDRVGRDLARLAAMFTGACVAY